MLKTTGEPVGHASRLRRRRNRNRLPFKTFAVLAAALAVGAGLSGHGDRHIRVVTAGPNVVASLAPIRPSAVHRLDPLFDASQSLSTIPVEFASLGHYDTLVDPDFSAGLAPRPFGQALPLRAELRAIAPARTLVASLPAPAAPVSNTVAPQRMIVASLPVAAADTGNTVVATALATPPVEAVEVITTPSADLPEPHAAPAPVVPLPMPRPAEAPVSAAPQAPVLVTPPAPRLAAEPLPRRTRMARLTPAPADNRSVFEKFFGGAQRPAGSALAYAATDVPAAPVRAPSLDTPFISSTAVLNPGTAIYDISARTVFLPNGERLEAHSGLGDKLDDPRQVSIKMRGPTPPHVYDLTEREQLFHGVRALRLTPVGGSGAVYGRVGLLAHTYMLGPRGDSNGCVSFRDYNRFLQAYLRGDIKRLVVVASRN